MQVTETLSDGLKRAFAVVVPGADIEQRRIARLTDLGRTLRLPGFRPGKVPLPIVRQRYGTAVTAEVLEELVSQTTQQVLTERGLRPSQTPKIDIASTDLGSGTAKDLEFKVELELLPDIVLPDLSKISLVRRRAEVPPEKVDQALAELTQRNRELVEITAEELGARGEDGGAAKGEVLTVEYQGKIDDKPFAGGTSKDVSIEVAGEGFIPGFSEQLAGMRPGECRTIEVRFPEEFPNKDLAGKPAVFEVTASRLSRPVIPEPNDTFAQKLAFDDLAELRKVLTERIQREYDSVTRLRLKRDLFDVLAAQLSFETPQGLVEQEFGQIWQQLEADRNAGRLDEDDKNKDEPTLRADYHAIAERRVRLGLLLAEIGRSNGITVSDEELNRMLRVQAARFPGQESQMMEFYRRNPAAADSVRGPMFEEKVIDHVLERVSLTDEVVTPDELADQPAPAETAGSETPVPETQNSQA